MHCETIFSLSAAGRDVPVDECSHFLGLEPSEFCRYLQRIPVDNSRSIQYKSYWTFCIRKCVTDTADAQLSSLLDIIHPKAAKFRVLADKYDLYVGTGTYLWLDDFNDSDLRLDINPTNISRLSDLNSDYGIEVFD